MYPKAKCIQKQNVSKSKIRNLQNRNLIEIFNCRKYIDENHVFQFLQNNGELTVKTTSEVFTIRSKIVHYLRGGQ